MFRNRRVYRRMNGWNQTNDVTVAVEEVKNDGMIAWLKWLMYWMTDEVVDSTMNYPLFVWFNEETNDSRVKNLLLCMINIQDTFNVLSRSPLHNVCTRISNTFQTGSNVL